MQSLLLEVQSRLVLLGEQGASLVEYALLLALIALVCVGALELIGSDVSAPLSGAGGSIIGGS